MNFTHYLRFLTLVFIGFANALPIPLMGSTLSIWLSEAGFDKAVIGSFALLGIPFSLKILWTPVVNLVSWPGFKDKPRKGWLLFALTGMALSLLGISFINPAHSSGALAFYLFLLSLFSGCLYIVGIAYELESLDETNYSVGSASVVTGYRIGLLSAGAGALYVSFLWDWSAMFQLMAALVALGGIFILFQPEPYKSQEILKEKQQQFASYSSLGHGFWHEVIVAPCRLFFQRRDWFLILALLLLFKLGDQLSGSMEGPFLLSLGFNKADLATASKLWGMAATVVGAFLAGAFLRGRDPFLSLGWIGMLHASSLGCYYVLALTGKFFVGLYVAVALQHLTGGMAMTVFIFFLWRMCDRRHAAVQYALLWSLFSLKANVVSFVGGMIAHNCAWTVFFGTVTCVGLVAATASWRCARVAQQQQKCEV